MSSMMCGVSHTDLTPSSSYRRRISKDSPIVRTPSSTPGRMCECQSVNPLKIPLSCNETRFLNGQRFMVSII